MRFLAFLSLVLIAITGCVRSMQLPPGAPMASAPGLSTLTSPAPWSGGEAAVADAVVGVAQGSRKPERDTPQPGILTAGSFDDNLDVNPFLKLVGKWGQNQSLGKFTSKLQGQRLVVLVKDATGNPVGNARVRLSQRGHNSTELLTRTDGRVVFLPGWDGVQANEALTVQVTPPSGQAVAQSIAAGSQRWEVVVSTTTDTSPRHLDVAFVLDTTGSMSDEHKYLTSEVRNIASAIQQKFPEVQQRYSLVVYRDEGDDYVTRSFDFRSVDDFQRQLAAQGAGGGGDYPEAMHRGLEDAHQHRWRQGNVARVLFLVGDAPPHEQHLMRTLQAVDYLRKKGVAVYPIACSGYDDTTELVMRSAALLTGSQFLFLTDDSGVGNSHAEPKIPYYQVERLDKLMTRLIAAELSGRRIDAAASDILRTVGKRVN